MFALKEKFKNPESWYPSSAKEIENYLKDFLKISARSIMKKN